MKKKLTIGIFLFITMVLLVTIGYKEVRLNKDDEPAISMSKDQSKDFGLSNLQTISGEPVDPHDLPESKECAGCHKDSYEEWKVSAHARSAANDPIYENHEETFAVAELGEDAITFCAGCHTPEGLMTGSIGKTKWTDRKYEMAGTSCITCHAIGEVVNDKKQGIPADASYVIAPERIKDYPFHGNEILEKLEEFMIRSAPARHAADYSSELYQEAEYCSSCHTQAAPNGKIEQDTYREWLDSPYSKEGSKEFATCIDCHMAPIPGKPNEEKKGQTTNGGKTKDRVLDHRFVGANQALPYLYGDQEMFERTEKMLRSAAEIDIVDVTNLSGQLAFKVKVTNTGTGHNLPTGATDLRQLWIDVEVIDQSGKVIFTSGKLDDKYEVDPSATMFHSKFYDKDGKLIDHHQVWRIYKREDNLIEPKKSKFGSYSLNIPRTSQKITVKAKLRYRVSPQYFANVTLREFAKPEDRILPITDIAIKEKVISVD